MVDMFEQIVNTYSQNIALAVKRVGEWKTWTYQSYHDEAQSMAKAFIEVGFY